MDRRREAQIELARRHIAFWAKVKDPSYHLDPFHGHLAGELDKVVSGETRNIIIQAPPQHGKSRLVTEMCSHWLGKHPDLPIITTSYSASLAVRNSRQIRAAVNDPVFRTCFGPIQVDSTRSASNDWGLAGHGGGVIAAGVGGPVTGHGAGLGVIDDPHKNAEEAYSSVMREKVWEWYETTFLTRIWEGGRVVLIQTRWHPDDLAGRLLERQPERWRVLNYPALCEDHYLDLPEDDRPGAYRADSLGREPGEPLAPHRFSRDHLEGVRETQGSLVWSALYQQRPTSAEGGVIRVDRIEVVDSPPPTIQEVRAWDFASTPEGAAADPDYTAGVLMGKTSDGRYVIIDVIRGRLSPRQVEAAITNTAKVDGQGVPVYFEQEPGASGALLASHYTRLLAGWSVWAERATGPQLSRVLPLAAQIEAGNLSLVRGPHTHALLEEMRAYRGDGKTHDDFVVAAALAFSKLTGGLGLMAEPPEEAPQPEAQEDPWL